MTKEKKNSAFMRPVHVTEELAAIVGPGPMARTEVTKALWKYIKTHDLQDPNDKRNIKPDEKLSKVLGSKLTINMFKMTGKVAEHIKEPAAAAK
jgi:chromatin remodeling complex protein RSC6